MLNDFFFFEIVLNILLLQVIRIIPYSAVQLFSYEVYKVVILSHLPLKCIFILFVFYFILIDSTIAYQIVETIQEKGWRFICIGEACCRSLCWHDFYTCELLHLFLLLFFLVGGWVGGVWVS